MKKWIKRLKPWMFENSKVPVWLSYISPIEIGAISFGPFVWSRGVMDDRLRRHETIHFHQQLECLFIFQWILYASFWAYGVVKHRGNGALAYYEIPFEKEAYSCQYNEKYLENRPFFAWTRYI